MTDKGKKFVEVLKEDPFLKLSSFSAEVAAQNEKIVLLLRNNTLREIGAK